MMNTEKIWCKVCGEDYIPSTILGKTRFCKWCGKGFHTPLTKSEGILYKRVRKANAKIREMKYLCARMEE